MWWRPAIPRKVSAIFRQRDGIARGYPATATADDNPPATDDAAGLRREIAFRDDKIGLLEAQLADLREDRDKWREQATRLLPAPRSRWRFWR